MTFARNGLSSVTGGQGGGQTGGMGYPDGPKAPRFEPAPTHRAGGSGDWRRRSCGTAQAGDALTLAGGLARKACEQLALNIDPIDARDRLANPQTVPPRL